MYVSSFLNRVLFLHNFRDKLLSRVPSGYRLWVDLITVVNKYKMVKGYLLLGKDKINDFKT